MKSCTKQTHRLEAKVFNTNATKEKLYVESQNLRVGNKFQNNNLPSSFYENDKNVGTTGLRSKIKLLKIRKKGN